MLTILNSVQTRSALQTLIYVIYYVDIRLAHVSL
jgi:hypothetical protein